MPYIHYEDGFDYDSKTLVFSISSRGVFDNKRKRSFYTRVLTWLAQEVFAMVESPVVIAKAPGHEASPNPRGFMHEIVNKIDHPKFAGEIPLY